MVGWGPHPTNNGRKKMNGIIANAFTFMFKDSDWKYKLMLLLFITIPSSLMAYLSENFKNVKTDDPQLLIYVAIFFIVVTSITTLLFEGYCDKCSQIVMNAKNKTTNKNLLPHWENNFWGFVKIGFVFNVALSVFIIFGGIIIAYFFVKNVTSMSDISSTSAVLELFKPLYIPFGIAFVIFFFFYVALKAVFCVDFKTSSLFALRRANKLIWNNIGYYFVVVVIMMLLQIAFAAFMYHMKSSPSVIFVGSALQAYIYLVMAYLRGALFMAPPEVFFNSALRMSFKN